MTLFGKETCANELLGTMMKYSPVPQQLLKERDEAKK